MCIRDRALTALIGGQVDYMCDQIVNLVQQVQGGQIKAYAIGTPERSPALPGVPTSQEAGLPQFQAQAWNALFAPKDTPQPVLDKLTDALDKALDDEQTRKRLLELGSVLPDKAGRGQQALAALVKSEIAAGRRSSRRPALRTDACIHKSCCTFPRQRGGR